MQLQQLTSMGTQDKDKLIQDSELVRCGKRHHATWAL